jgi:hypothetical protein
MGITAAFLYCEGYRLRISLMSSLFCGVNLKGIEALLTGESRCYIRGQRRSESFVVQEIHTTLRESLRGAAVMLNARH